MATLPPNPYGDPADDMSPEERRAYDAYCDAIVDASEAEMERTGITYTWDEVREHARAEWARLEREYPRKNWGQPCSQ